MVAPHNVGEPVRSFVRVPGEGRAAKALCWDLSRSSSVVAAVAPLQLPPPHPLPPPPLLPPSAAVAQDPARPSIPGQKQVPAAPSPSLPKTKQQVPQPVPQQGAAVIPNEGKRLRDEEEQQMWNDFTPKSKVARTTAGGRSSAGGVQQPISGSAQPQPGSEEEVQWLRQQCRKLQQQNEALQQRLVQIHSLLKDKQHRSNLVKQLDALVK